MKHKTKLIAEIDVLLQHSLSNVLYNQLSKYKTSIESFKSFEELCIANERFGRFIVDSFNWDDPYYKKCSEIRRLGLSIEHELKAN